MTVLYDRILLDFTIELEHDLMIHLLNFFLKLGDFLLDGDNLGLELLEFELMNVFDFFHLGGFFQMSNDLGLFELNCFLFILKLFD